MILAGDIGGTKTLLAIFPEEKRTDRESDILPVRLLERSYPSREFDSFDQVLQAFMTEVRSSLDSGLLLSSASFGVAGPVVRGRCETTNLPWILDSLRLAAMLSLPPARVHLQNDLAAIAWGTLTGSENAMTTLNRGVPDPAGTRIVVAPGTGLGESIIAFTEAGPTVLPSEGGHADWAPESPEDIPLLDYLWSTFGHASTERLVSGQGLATLYRFQTRSLPKDSWPLDPEISDDELPAAITHKALSSEDPFCVRILEQFCGLLGQESGNMALKALATGGVTLAGGIPGKILPFLLKSRFMDHFTNKGRYRTLLEKIPVHVSTDPDIGLLGARAFAARAEGAPFR